MALKPQREERVTDISRFMNEVAERGGITYFGSNSHYNTYTGLGPSGAALDQAANLVTYGGAAAVLHMGSGLQPAGILLNDVVNLDLTRQELNWHKNEVQVGSKVTLLTQGWCVTDFVKPGVTVTPGDFAYGAESGYITNTVHTSHPRAYPLIGRWETRKDDEGFAKLTVNIPLPMVTAK